MTRLIVKVVPKSGRFHMKFEQKNLKVWLKSAPENGAANEELERMLAKKLRVARLDVKIIRGFSSKIKSVDISGISIDEIKKSVG